MKLIIAGSRTIDLSVSEIAEIIEQTPFDPTLIVCGTAKGIDTSGWAFGVTFALPVREFPADWDAHGRAAGPIRNKQMAMYADALLLIWDGKSKGSANMKKEMTKLGKPIHEVIINGTN